MNATHFDGGKQVAAHVRKTLAQVANKGGQLRSNATGVVIEIPPGLGFTVRATRAGAVNITIEDRGWVDRVTGGDRPRVTDHQAERAAIRAEVDKLRSTYTPPLSGKTEWGLIYISSQVTSVRSSTLEP